MSGGVARAERYDERVDLQLREKLRGDEIVVNDGHVSGLRREICWYKIQVNESKLSFMRTLRRRARLPGGSLRLQMAV